MIGKELSEFIKVVSLIISIFPMVSLAGSSFAQVIPDNSLGKESSQINLETIEKGAIRGENLFHSFSQFSIQAGQVVNFYNPEGVSRIFSRVTGGSVSKIDGILGVLGKADLFLLNPNGIIFGPNASLNLSGSFIGTTAQNIVFSDGTIFSANPWKSSPILTVSAPTGLQFGNNLSSIVNQSIYQPAGILLGLEVTANNTLALVGGDVFIQGGSLTAFDGRIELVSVAPNSQVQLQPVDKGWALNTGGVNNFQDIKISGPDLPSLLAASSFREADTGEIYLQGRNITLTDNSQIQAVGGIVINATDTLKISGVPDVNSEFESLATFSGLIAASVSTQKGGNITINTKKLILEQNGRIITGVLGIFFSDGLFIPATGKGGDIDIKASDSVQISGKNSSLSSGTIGIGNAGDIFINSPQISLSNGAQILAATQAQGHAGNIQITGVNRLNISGKDTGIIVNSQRLEGQPTSFPLGNAGNININANFVTLDNQGIIAANSASADGGNINLNAADLLTLRRGSTISTNAGENGGNITINAGFIFALPQEDSNIAANAITGQGGNINITTQGIFGIEPREKSTPLSDITASSDFGLAGTVNINNAQIEPQQSIQELPQKLLDVANLIDQSLCSVGRGSELTVTGRGGLPSSPQQTLAADNLWEDWRLVEAGAPRTQRTPSSPARAETEATPREFQGWTVNARGNVVLTAAAIVVTPQGDWLPPPGCQHLIKSLQ